MYIITKSKQQMSLKEYEGKKEVNVGFEGKNYK